MRRKRFAPSNAGTETRFMAFFIASIAAGARVAFFIAFIAFIAFGMVKIQRWKGLVKIVILQTAMRKNCLQSKCVAPELRATILLLHNQAEACLCYGNGNVCIKTCWCCGSLGRHCLHSVVDDSFGDISDKIRIEWPCVFRANAHRLFQQSFSVSQVSQYASE